jgi:epoxyqueuosine reductase
LNYYPVDTQKDKEAPKISKYAYGRDYHKIIKDKLHKLLQFICTVYPEANGRVFVDSAPVMDKVWAARSGIGWIGKNTNLISRKYGSFVFIGELIVDLELEYDVSIKDYCGTCTRCIDACPTGAIVKPYLLDARKCISCFTVEYKEELPSEMKGKFENWVFGCDICQDVCPWNQNPVPHNEPDFNPHPGLLEMTKDEWFNLSEERYSKIFKDSAVKRVKYSGMKRNIEFIKEY